MTRLCRDCLDLQPDGTAEGACGRCGGHRMLSHPELGELGIAHIDCDAFYASIEKRDRPELRDRPVVVGGARRGVVAAACYIARLYGVRSAMPMFKALQACPDAVVIKPDMAKYQDVGRAIRQRMLALTPLVEPLSIDEAYLDLQGTEIVHGGPPALSLARLALEIERDFGLTVSVGLSGNKFLAKIASDLDKPRGFAVIGRAEAQDFLADKPVSLIWGVGKALARRLERDGIRRIADLLPIPETELVARYGAMGRRLYRFARGEDSRPVEPNAPTKSISAETTFNEDLSEAVDLERALWPLCETVARRLRRQGLLGISVTLKLKTADFRQFTRSHRLSAPTYLAEIIFRAGREMVRANADGRRFRLIGIGLSDFKREEEADQLSLLDADVLRQHRLEDAMTQVREKSGSAAIQRGRSLLANDRRKPSA